MTVFAGLMVLVGNPGCLVPSLLPNPGQMTVKYLVKYFCPDFKTYPTSLRILTVIMRAPSDLCDGTFPYFRPTVSRYSTSFKVYLVNWLPLLNQGLKCLWKGIVERKTTVLVVISIWKWAFCQFLILLHLRGDESGWRNMSSLRGSSDHKKLSMSYAISCALKTMQKLRKW